VKRLRTAKKAAIAAFATLSAFALSGCGFFEVESPNGLGACDSALSIVTDQTLTGETLSITYTGQPNVGLFFAQGFYGEGLPPGGMFSHPNLLIAWGAGLNGDLVKLDTTAPGWTTTTSGADTVHSFSGTIEVLLNGVPSPFDNNPGFGPEVTGSIMPGAVAVDCDPTHDSASIAPENWASRPFAAAQPLFPHSIMVDPFVMVESSFTAAGATATLRYADSAQSAFGSFQPEAPSEFFIVEDDPDVPNDTIADLWWQTLLGGTSGAGSMTVTGTNPDGSFNVSLEGPEPGEALANGSYLMYTIVPNADESAARVVFSPFTYDGNTGLSFTDGPEPAPEPEPMLADTGVSASTAAALVAFGAATIVSGAILLVLRRRHAG